MTVAGSIGLSGQVVVGEPTAPGDANGPLSGGYIIVNGSLQQGGHVIARQGLANETAFIAVNWAGGTAGDSYLGGSRVWHCDASCDGTADVDDVTPLTTLASDNGRDPNCPGRSSGDGMDGGMPGGNDN
jgi:hypothetical protein